MKHKNILLVVFLLVLFAFQQVQAGATMPPAQKSSKVNPALANANILYTNLYVYIYILNPPNGIKPGAIQDPPTLCKYPKDEGTYGCGNTPPTYQGSSNPQKDQQYGFYYLVPDQDYLPNVLPNEMDFADFSPDAEALRAQAIAARTFASWKSANGPQQVVTIKGVDYHIINNSTDYQVYIPGTYNDYLNYQGDVTNAVNATANQYLSAGDGHTIDAEFSSDITGTTGDGGPSYLKPVEEPIAPSPAGTCKLGATGNGYGMSQRGAMRWARGNVCPDGTGAAWPLGTTSPIKWNYKQILAHYYTGIDFLTDNGGTQFAPDDRWNLLNYNAPATATAGGTFAITMTLQNTSATSSNWANVVIGYKWNNEDWTVLQGVSASLGNPPTDLSLSIPVPSDLPTGATLHLDLGHQIDSQTVNWFSNSAYGGWPDAEIPVTVNGGGGQQTIGISISQGSDDGGTNPTPCTFSATDNEVYLGECFNNAGNITSGFRFNNVQIPSGAHVDSAYITFTVDGPYSVPVNVRIYGDNTANSDTFSDSNPPSNRPSTNDSVSWNIPSTDVWNLGETRNTPDLSKVIQDIVNPGTGWNTGNSLSIIFANNSSTNVRRVIAFERASWDPTLHAAQLFVTYDLSTPTPTPTPLPTSTPLPPTPVPTIAPTIAPTPTPQPTNSMCWCIIWWWFGDCGPTSAQRNFTVALNTANHAAADINLFYQVRDDILAKTPEGQRFIDLYDTYSPELIQIAEANPNVKSEIGEMIDMWSPNLQALVDGKGDQAVITAEQITAMEKFVQDIYVNASPEFQQAITDTLARHPMDPLVGMTMDQAWANLNGYQLTWLPPLTTANPYTVQNGSTIPIEFTLTDFKGNFAIDNSVTLKILDANGNVVVGPIGINGNPTQGITIQGTKYHYNFQTTGLAVGSYTIQVSYTSASGQPATYGIQLAAGKK